MSRLGEVPTTGLDQQLLAGLESAGDGDVHGVWQCFQNGHDILVAHEDAGLRLVRGHDVRLFPWNEIREVQVPTSFVAKIVTGTDEAGFAFTSMAEQRRFLTQLATYLPRNVDVPNRPDPQPVPGVRRPVKPTAGQQLRTILIWSILVQLGGALIALIGWPRVVMDSFEGPHLTGSWVITWFGLTVAWAGACATFVALIGYGVMLGTRAARESS